MAWITLAETDVLDVLNADELDQYRTLSTQPGQTDPLPGILSNVTNEVRGYVRNRYELGAAGTIPDALKSAALDIIAWRLANRVAPSTADKRKPAKDDAIALLKSVAAGEFGIDAPAVSAGETVSAPAPGMTEKTRTWTQTDEDGI
jgi:phage gp36-like protein